MREIRGVTFDFWNTLVAENPEAPKRRIGAQVATLAEFDLERSPEQVEAAGRRMWEWFHESWRTGDAVDHVTAAGRLIDELGLAEAANDALTAALAGVYRTGGDPSTLRVADGVHDTLVALRERGVRIGIISDVGFTPGVRLREYLEHHGLLELFDGWTFSDEVGRFKPSAVMFEHAATSLGIDGAAHLAHIGDLRRTDVEGARRAGWLGIRYRGLHDDDVSRSPRVGDPERGPTPDADVVIDHHDQLLGALGLD